MAKLIGPDFIALQVTDLERSRQFYSEQVGLVAAPHSPPDAIVFDTKPIPFAIRRPMVDLSAVDRLGWGVSLWIASDDADGLHNRLAAAGVTVVLAPADGPFGRFFSFRDPDGYTITAHQAQPKHEPVVLDPAADHLVLINTFVVEPDRAEALFDVLSKATETTMRRLPGFVSANLHISKDRKHIANYAQWRNKEMFDAMIRNPEAQVHMREAADIATSYTPLFYKLCESHPAAEEAG